jgi:hypothetical protein
VCEAEAPSDPARDRALPRTGRAVDGNYHDAAP